MPNGPLTAPDDAAAPAHAEDRLPEWDLADLYPGRDSPELNADLVAATAAARSFAERYQGRLGDLPGAALGAAIADYERQQERLGRILSYAQLVPAGNLSAPAIRKVFQTMQEKAHAIATDLLFFTLP